MKFTKMYERKITADNLGEKIKKVRKEKNISIKQVSSKLKIREEYIKAIEEGNFDIFPAEVYTKGFLKKYSKFLGLNESNILKIYKREKGVQRGFIEKSNKIEAKQMFLTSRKSIYALSLIFLIFIVAMFSFKIFVVNKKPTLKIYDPLFASPTDEEKFFTYDTEQDILNIRGEIETGNSLFLNNESINTFGLSKFEIKEIDLEQGSNTFYILTKNQFGVENSMELEVLLTTKELYGPFEKDDPNFLNFPT